MTDHAHEFIGFIVKSRNVLIPCTKAPSVWEIFSFVFLSLMLYANRLSLNTTKSEVLFVGLLFIVYCFVCQKLNKSNKI